VIRHVNKVAVAIGDVLQRLDSVLRRWEVAGLFLLILALVLAAATALER
jgi:hypothetical protein